MSDTNDMNTTPIITATILALSFAIVAVVLRYIARRYQSMETYAEDWCIYAALVCKIGIDICGCILIENGLGHHIDTLTSEQLVAFAKTQFCGAFIYPACITFVKLSILSQYRRVFASHSDAFKWQINALVVIVLLWGVGIMITACFLCTPIDKLWNLDPKAPGTCIDIVKFYYGLQIPNILTDLLIIVVPIREILGLDLTRKLKVGAIAMFLLGTVTLCFDIVRLTAMVALTGVTDQTYHLVDAALWTTVEPTVAIVAVCIPSVRSLTRARSGARSTDQWVSDRSDAAITSVQEYVKPVRLPSEDNGIVELGMMQNRTRPIGDEKSDPGQDWVRVNVVSEHDRSFQRFK